MLIILLQLGLYGIVFTLGFRWNSFLQKKNIIKYKSILKLIKQLGVKPSTNDFDVLYDYYTRYDINYKCCRCCNVTTKVGDIYMDYASHNVNHSANCPIGKLMKELENEII